MFQHLAKDTGQVILFNNVSVPALSYGQGILKLPVNTAASAGNTGQVILEPPLNTAASVGDTVRLNCSADFNSDLLEWRHYLDSTTGDRIWLSDESGQPSDPR